MTYTLQTVTDSFKNIRYDTLFTEKEIKAYEDYDDETFSDIVADKILEKVDQLRDKYLPKDSKEYREWSPNNNYNIRGYSHYRISNAIDRGAEFNINTLIDIQLGFIMNDFIKAAEVFAYRPFKSIDDSHTSNITANTYNNQSEVKQMQSEVKQMHSEAPIQNTSLKLQNIPNNVQKSQFTRSTTPFQVDRKISRHFTIPITPLTENSTPQRVLKNSSSTPNLKIGSPTEGKSGVIRNELLQDKALLGSIPPE